MNGKKFSKVRWKTNIGCREATEKHYDKIFEEMKELEEKKSKEALLIVQKSTIYGDINMRSMKQEGCRELETHEEGQRKNKGRRK